MKSFKICLILLLISTLSLFSNNAEDESRKPITLQESIQTALKNNLDLQIEIENYDYLRQALRINKGIFIPRLTVDARKSETNRPASGVLSGADVTNNKQESLSLGLEQKIPLGGTFNVSLENAKTRSNSYFSSINPALYTDLRVTLNQPLLKGFGILATKKDIIIADNDMKKNNLQLKATVINLVYQVEEAYWNLVYAYQNLEAKKKSLLRAKDLLRQNEKKVKVGAAARIDILEAKAEVASYESQLIQAEQLILTSEENLKKILNVSQQKEMLLPSDLPDTGDLKTNFNDFLFEALQNRPDIQQAKIDLENNNVQVRYARNQMLPELQITASYYTTGRGGDQLIFEPGSNPFDPSRPVIGVISKDIWEAISEAVKAKYKNYSVGLSLSIPLSFSVEKARLAQAKINLKKSLLNLKKIENTIYSEIKEALKELATNRKLVESNQIALTLQEQKLKAEEKKLSVGMSTNYQVLNYQRDFANAQTNALQSNINYNLSMAKINKLLARTFSAYSIKFRSLLK